MNYSKLIPSVNEVSSSTEEVNERSEKGRTFFQCFTWTCSILFSGLWLAPAVFLLVINFRGQYNARAGVVGPSIGCLGNSERCRLNLQDVNQIAQAQKLAILDKNALGALQLAAKGLEVWFLTIAASLAFILIKIIARRTSRPSLPLRLMYLHTMLGEIASLASLLLWKPMERPLKNLLRQIRRGRLDEYPAIRDQGLSLQTTWLYLFSIFVLSLSVICSVMGPATAVLVLPSMQWTKINDNLGSAPLWLDTIGAGQPPHDISVPSCTSDNLTAGNFSCLSDYYSSFVDSVAAGAVATDTHAFLGGGDDSGIRSTLVVLPVFQQGNVTFSANISGANPVIWVPLRQTLRGFNEDVEDYDLATSKDVPPQPGYPDSDLFKKSLQARLQRHGPTIGMQSNCRLSGLAEQTVSSLTFGTDQTVRCYKFSSGTKCIPSGNGWSGIDLSTSSFVVLDDPTTRKNINATIYSSSTSLVMPNSAFQCVVNNTCGWDWSSAFSNRISLPNTTVAGPLQAIEYSSPTATNDSSIWCASNYVRSTAQYVLDPSKVSNLFRHVDLNVDGDIGTTATGKPLYVHSEWILAAWAVDRNGFVNEKRKVADLLIVAWQNWIVYGDHVQSFADFINIHRFIAIQSLSFIPYTNTSIQPAGDAKPDLSLSQYAQIQAWKYDLSSHTSKLGAVVIIAGCILVLLRTMMYWYHGDDLMDATEILQSILARYTFIQDEETGDVKEGYPLLITDDITGNIGFRARQYTCPT